MNNPQPHSEDMNTLTEEEKTLIANAHIASVEAFTGRQPLYEVIAQIKHQAQTRGFQQWCDAIPNDAGSLEVEQFKEAFRRVISNLKKQDE